MLIVVLLWCQFYAIACTSVREMNVFLTQGETWLLFPHRQFYLYTYTTTCSAKSSSQTNIEYKQFKTIQNIPIDNTCLHIDVLKNSPDKQQSFLYGKLTKEGLCTVYRVHNHTASIFYQYSSGKQLTSLLMMNELNVFVWNAKEFIILQYSLYSQQINVYSMQFSTESQRKCTLNNAYSIYCWNDDELIFLNFFNYNINLTVYAYDWDPIVQVFPLSAQDKFLLICSMQICNVSSIEQDRITVQQSLPFVGQIMGGSVHEETNTFVIVMSQSLSLYSFNFFEKIQLTHLDTINFPSEFDCSHYSHSLLLSEMIVVECFNFESQAQKLILSKDLTSNYFFAFNPMERSNYTNSWVSGNNNQLLILYEDEIVIKQTNFYFLALSNPESQLDLSPIQLVCIRFDTVGSKEQSRYLINVLPAQLGNAYINEKLQLNQTIVYNQLLNFELSDYFKASDILSYKFTTNCTFIDSVTYSPLAYQQYFSLYNRQRCIQIVAGGGKLFYRLLQINSTLFYVQQCLPLSVGFGCQLIDIYDRVKSPRLAFRPEGLYAFYIQDERLKVKRGQNARRVFSEAAFSFDISDTVVRVKNNDGYYFSQIQGLIGQTGNWSRQVSGDRYFFQGTSILQLTADLRLLEHVGRQVRVLLNRQQLVGILSSEPQLNEQLPLPVLLKQGDFVFIIYKSSMTKVYMRQSPMLLFSIPINTLNRQIADVRITDIYLTIKFEPSGFEIYDITQQAIAVRIASIEENISTDIISLDTRTILIPIQSTTSLICIDRTPTISIGSFTPKYHLFHQLCQFRLALARQQYNGSEGPEETTTELGNQSDIYQQFTLQIRYYIEQIDLDDTIEIQQYPQQCDNCTLELKQLNFLGPIFSYELNDDYYGQFQLIPHLTVQDCLPYTQQTLLGLLEVRFEGDYLNNEVLMMDGSLLYLMDNQLAVLNSYSMESTDYCSSYLKLGQQYLVLCNKYFLLLSKEERKGAFLHSISISYQTRYQVELQFQQITDNVYYLIILDHDIEVHIYQLSLQSRSVEHLQKYSFNKVIDDLKVINNQVIVLKYQHICIYHATPFLITSDSTTQKCFLLADVIPHNYASAYNYEAFIPYFSDGTLIRALLIAKSVEDLHIDIEINLTTPFTFKILNAYAGYGRFGLKEIIAVNKTSNSYSYFILLYQCEDTSGYMVAYYKFNERYTFDGTIGQIRSAQLLSSYFYSSNHLTFTTFHSQMFITHSNLADRGFQKKRQCLSVTVKDNLSVLLNYQQTPPLKFLILQARNLNQMSNHFIRLRFIPSTDQIWQILICLTVLVTLLAGIVISTNHCKQTESDLEADLVFEEVEGPSRQDGLNRSRDGSWPLSEEQPVIVRDSTSLLHSKQSEYVPPNEYEGSDQNDSEAIIFRGD